MLLLDSPTTASTWDGGWPIGWIVFAFTPTPLPSRPLQLQKSWEVVGYTWGTTGGCNDKPSGWTAEKLAVVVAAGRVRPVARLCCNCARWLMNGSRYGSESPARMAGLGTFPEEQNSSGERIFGWICGVPDARSYAYFRSLATTSVAFAACVRFHAICRFAEFSLFTGRMCVQNRLESISGGGGGSQVTTAASVSRPLARAGPSHCARLAQRLVSAVASSDGSNKIDWSESCWFARTREALCSRADSLMWSKLCGAVHWVQCSADKCV